MKLDCVHLRKSWINVDEQVIGKRRQGKKKGRMFETEEGKKDMGLMDMYMYMTTVLTGTGKLGTRIHQSEPGLDSSFTWLKVRRGLGHQ